MRAEKNRELRNNLQESGWIKACMKEASSLKARHVPKGPPTTKERGVDAFEKKPMNSDCDKDKARRKELEKLDFSPFYRKPRPPDKPAIDSVEPIEPPRRYSRALAPETFSYASDKHGGERRNLTHFLTDESVNEEYKQDMKFLYGCLDRFANDPSYIERKRSESVYISGGAQLYDCPQWLTEKSP